MVWRSMASCSTGRASAAGQALVSVECQQECCCRSTRGAHMATQLKADALEHQQPKQPKQHSLQSNQPK